MSTVNRASDLIVHLARRFFHHITAKPLSPSEQTAVVAALDGELRRLFYTQSVADQRHAVMVLERVGDRTDLAEAALLHDVGKTTSQLGAVQRSMATLWSFTALATWGSWAAYLQHGELGAKQLEEAGASDLSIAFARYHPGAAPQEIDPTAWQLLAAADEI